jgi:hypothetical protein
LIATFDYTGAATLVAATGGVLASVFSFLNGRKGTAIKKTGENVAAAVTMSDGTTIAGAVEGIIAAGTPNGKPIPTNKIPPPAP